MSIEDMFISSIFPDIRELGKLSCIEKQIQLICDVRKISNQYYYKLNHDLCLKWLKFRTEIICQSTWCLLVLFRNKREKSSRIIVHSFSVYSQGSIGRGLQGSKCEVITTAT